MLIPTSSWTGILFSICLQIVGLFSLVMWMDIGWQLVFYYRWKRYYAWNHPIPEKVETKQRKKWSIATRSQIEYEQRYRCPLCWRLLPAERDLDHIRPLHQLGADAEWNLQMLDGNCHNRKTRSTDPLKKTHQITKKRKQQITIN